jgi:hypothetical protein
VKIKFKFFWQRSHKKRDKRVIYKMMQMYHVHGVNVGENILLVLADSSWF